MVVVARLRLWFQRGSLCFSLRSKAKIGRGDPAIWRDDFLQFMKLKQDMGQ